MTKARGRCVGLSPFGHTAACESPRYVWENRPGWGFRGRIRLGKERPPWDQPPPTGQLEGDFYHIKTGALPSGRVWGSLCPLRQRPGRLPSERDHGSFSQKRPRFFFRDQGVPPQTDIGDFYHIKTRATSLRPRPRHLSSDSAHWDSHQGDSSQKKQRASLLRQGPGHLPSARDQSDFSQKDLGSPFR